MPLGVNLPLQELGSSAQLLNTIKQLALAASILVHATPHTIKREVARDMAHSKAHVAGIATKAVALVLHHDEATLRSGTTQMYVGDPQTATYNIRAEERFQDRLAPMMGSAPIEVQRNSKADVDAYMEEHNMNKTVPKQRQAAARALKGAKIEAVQAFERNRDDSTPAIRSAASSTLQTGTGGIGRGKTLIFPHARANILVEQGVGALTPKTKSAINVSQGQLGKKVAGGKVLSEEEEIPIDPQLELDTTVDGRNDEVDDGALEAVQSLMFENGGTTPNTAEDQIADVMVLEHLNDMFVSPPQEDKTNPLDLEHDQFVDWFAKINVCKTQTAKNDADFVEIAPSGNSKDSPSHFLFHCGIGQCQFKSWSPHELDHHQIGCQGINKTEKYFSCGVCEKTFLTEDGLSSHMRFVHEFTSRPYLRCPNSPDVLYNGFSELQAHQYKIHNVFDESCNLPDKLYTKPTTLQAHLKNIHKQTVEQIQLYIPTKERIRQHKEWKCPLGDECDKPFNAKGNLEVRNHLKRKHSFTEEEALEMVPLSKAEKTSQTNREANGKKEKSQWKCPVDDCSPKGPMKSKHRRRRHLIGVHEWSEADAVAHVPFTEREIANQAKKGGHGLLDDDEDE